MEILTLDSKEIKGIREIIIVLASLDNFLLCHIKQLSLVFCFIAFVLVGFQIRYYNFWFRAFVVNEFLCDIHIKYYKIMEAYEFGSIRN